MLNQLLDTWPQMPEEKRWAIAALLCPNLKAFECAPDYRGRLIVVVVYLLQGPHELEKLEALLKFCTSTVSEDTKDPRPQAPEAMKEVTKQAPVVATAARAWEETYTTTAPDTFQIFLSPLLLPVLMSQSGGRFSATNGYTIGVLDDSIARVGLHRDSILLSADRFGRVLSLPAAKTNGLRFEQADFDRLEQAIVELQKHCSTQAVILTDFRCRHPSGGIDIIHVFDPLDAGVLSAFRKVPGASKKCTAKFISLSKAAGQYISDHAGYPALAHRFDHRTWIATNGFNLSISMNHKLGLFCGSSLVVLTLPPTVDRLDLTAVKECADLFVNDEKLWKQLCEAIKELNDLVLAADRKK